ncbi:MAG TPA: hypothetical protein VJC00_01540 [Candidatus Nanoarchaeia archaeon]|nr:hypothetical protein [Candidatus Nanoarchaeia archaeon]
MYCAEHGKAVVGSCQWCGKPICKLDVGKAMGKKVFCRHCSSNLGSYIEKRQLDQIRKEREVESRKRQYSKIFESY